MRLTDRLHCGHGIASCALSQRRISLKRWPHCGWLQTRLNSQRSRRLMPGGGVSGMPDCSVTGGVLPERSFGQRALLEEGGFVFSETPEPFRIERSELLGPVDPAQGPVHEQTQILVAAAKAKRYRLVSKEPVNDEQVLRDVSLFCQQ